MKLAPGDPLARLARAESLLLEARDREEARVELASLAADPDPAIGPRARALLHALSQ